MTQDNFVEANQEIFKRDFDRKDPQRERKIKMELFCGKCSLQFDKKIVFDVHMSFVHNIRNDSANDEKLTEIREENGSSQETDVAKPNENSTKQTVWFKPQ